MNRLLHLSLFAALAVAGLSAHAQTSPLTVALTFDDLPAHGQKPADETRLEIAQSILATLRQERLPPVFGFVNGIRVQEAPDTMDVLRA